MEDSARQIEVMASSGHQQLDQADQNGKALSAHDLFAEKVKQDYRDSRSNEVDAEALTQAEMEWNDAAPPPPAQACGQWKEEKTQCNGLVQKLAQDAQTPEGCARACCDDVACNVWQFGSTAEKNDCWVQGDTETPVCNGTLTFRAGGWQKAKRTLKRTDSSIAAFRQKFRRTNLCKNIDEMAKDERNLPHGLQGARLKVFSPMQGGASKSYLSKDKDGKWQGFDYKVLEEVARRGGFTFDIVQGDVEDPQNRGNGTFTMLNRDYDIVLEHNTEQGMKSGGGKYAPFVSSVYPLVDASLVLATNIDQHPNGGAAEGWNFSVAVGRLTAPYEPSVWIAFILMCIGTCFAYWIVERRPEEEGKSEDPVKPEAEKLDGAEAEAADTASVAADQDEEIGAESRPKDIATAMYMTIMHCTTMANYSPRSWAGRVIVIFFTLSCVVFLAGYNANLANIFIEESSTSGEWKDIDDVVKANARICVVSGKSSERYMNTRYPRFMNLKTVEKVAGASGVPVLEALKTNRCDAAVLWKMNLDVGMKKKQYNDDCNLQQIGDALNKESGSWSVFADYRTFCTALVRDVLHYHLMKMDAEGQLGRLYYEFIDAQTTRTESCASQQKREQDDGSGLGLKLKYMWGLFVLDAVGVFLGLAMWKAQS